MRKMRPVAQIAARAYAATPTKPNHGCHQGTPPGSAWRSNITIGVNGGMNCHCFDPSKTFVLNPAAWSEPGPLQFGTAAAYSVAPQLTNAVTGQTTSGFGQVNTVGGGTGASPRSGQLVARFTF